MKIRALIVPLIAAALMLPAVACGGDDDNDAQPTQASGATQPTQASGQTQATATRPAGNATAAPTSPAGIVATIASGPGALAIEACRLFTKDEATTALGEAVGDPEGINVGTQTVAPGLTVSIQSCTYQSSSGKSVEVTFWRAGGTTSPQVRQVYEQFLCDQKEKVQGLGDVACWYDSSHTELLILKGATFFDVQISGVSGRENQLRTLAQRALGRLQ